MKKILALIGILLLGGAIAFAQWPASPPAIEVASVNLTGKNANISATTAYAPVPNLAGLYRADCYVVETTADAASSTLPSCSVLFTDSDSATAETVAITSTSTANSVGTVEQGTTLLNIGAGTIVQYETGSYASGTSGVMKYAIHFRLIYVGP